MSALLGTGRSLIAILAGVLVCCSSAAVADDNLYRAQTVVTGQLEPNRLLGFGTCLEDVLIKVSGQPELAGDIRLVPYKARAREFVSDFSYHDQFAGKPHRDEQGTRDRPYDLTVEFDGKKVDGLLGELGLKPWLSHRPVLGVFVEMQQGPKDFIVTTDGAQSELQRDALAAAADKRGMHVVLPASAALAAANVTAAKLLSVPLATLASIASGSEAVLVGRLVWDDNELGWATQWQLVWQGKDHTWRFRGVTFDEAFVRSVGGAAQVLSGNGDPGRTR
ncbi:DUF2066 domain-containing protein [Bradyrhizobium jicamae]|uniref:DUF2066 domain-containing protein n=1 Tax=Bradyrhizobium jicamae TaxID=280332 RepID=A0ABS5FRJ9_9BRAD|nr:DUF2066 domain-containing protein [Bradyrhizobium jicamae]MBR0799431.1 DUF2066 domain-containing protein [Bradyrhizobium jicamae]